MLSLVVMMRAHEESLTKSRRLKAAWEGKRRRASEEMQSACCPSWLQASADRCHFVLIQERAEVIRQVYEMSAQGEGVMRIARSLNTGRVPIWTRGKSWHSSFVHRLLTSRSVLGEYQPRTWNGGRSVPAGAPIPGYFPPAIEVDLWEKARERRRQGTPGRRGDAVINLFRGLVFDGASGTPMRLIQWNQTPAAVDSSDHGCYLVSDYARLSEGERATSWRYGWFERWCLDHLQSLSRSPEERARSQEEFPRQELSEQETASVRLKAEISRLVKIARTSDRPPDALVAEMKRLEDEQAVVLERTTTLQKRLDAVQAQVDSVEDERNQLKELAQATDERSRLRLRHLIRKHIHRIDLFPRGHRSHPFADAPQQTNAMPCFRIRFTDEQVSWVCCPNRNPDKVDDGHSDRIPA